MGTIKPKIGICLDCPPGSKPQRLIAGRCKWCYWKHRSELKTGPQTKFPNTLKAISKKQMMNNRLYLIVRRVYLRANLVCLAVQEGCTHLSTEVHHKRGRGEFLLKKETFLPVCQNCHQWIELHPVRAKQLGLSEDRLAKLLP